MSFSITAKGLIKATEKMRRLQHSYPAAFHHALFEEFINIMRLARNKAPERTGHLKRSAFLTDNGNPGDADYNIIGGFGAHYAYIVHQTHRSKAQFLVQALDERKRGANRRIAYRTQRNVDMVTGRVKGRPNKSEFNRVPTD